LYLRAIKLFSPSTNEYNSNLNDTYFNFFKFGSEFYWNPSGQDTNRLFARINYIEPIEIHQKRWVLQIQIGYSLLLSNIIKNSS